MRLSKCLLACSLAVVTTDAAFASAMPVDLGLAGSFAVLAGSAVTNTGATVLDGNLGIWPNNAITGFPPGIVVDGNTHAGDDMAMQSEAALTGAYQAASGEAGAQSMTGQDLGGMTLVPGVYSFASSAQLTGTLTLDAAHASNAVFIFQIATTLTTAMGALVQTLDFGSGDQVIWQVGSSATLGNDTGFVGDILAQTSVTLDTGAGITCGGALAIDGAVTLQSNSISTTGSSCNPERANVPEPSSLVLLLAGVSAATVARSRRPTRRSLFTRSRLWAQNSARVRVVQS